MNQHQQSVISASTLYVVPTPIGNLGDITHRALEVLKSVDLIAAEDTRHTGLLLQHFAINARLFALHDHNEQQKADQLLAKLQEGQSIALVSDAGTPLISDPGFRLVQAARAAHLLQLRLQLDDAVGDQASVDLDLSLAGAAGRAGAAALTLQVGPGADQARPFVVQPRQFDLQAALLGPRAATEDFQDQARAVDDLGALGLQDPRSGQAAGERGDAARVAAQMISSPPTRVPARVRALPLGPRAEAQWCACSRTTT